MKKLIVLAGLFAVSCLFPGKYSTLVCEGCLSTYGGTFDKCVLTVPRGYELVESVPGTTFSTEAHYSDSSIIYIYSTESLYYLNTDNLNNATNMRDQRNLAYFQGDTITVYGRDSLGLFWKDVMHEFYSFGYLNVPQERKEAFDSALQTFRWK